MLFLSSLNRNYLQYYFYLFSYVRVQSSFRMDNVGVILRMVNGSRIRNTVRNHGHTKNGN